MSDARREELRELVETLNDDQVDRALVMVRRMAGREPAGAWPPKFVGMIQGGPEDGSSPEYLESVLAGGFGKGRE